MEFKPATGRTVTTGELRGALQPIRFGILTAPALAYDNDEEVFAAGDHVALQYWGNGMIRLTVTDSHITRCVHANSVRMSDPEIRLS